MRTFLYIITLVTIIASCNNSSKRDTIIISEEKHVTDSFIIIKKSENFSIDSFMSGSPQLSVEFNIHCFVSKNKERESNINNSVINHIFGFKDISIKLAMDSFTNAIKEEYIQLWPEYYNEKNINGGDGEWFNYNYNIISEITEGRNKVINYSIHNISYTGGPHGSDFYTFINFDPKSGKEIKLDDIFKNNYYEALTDRLIVALAKQKGAKSQEELHEMGYLVLNDMYPTDNFILGNDSITFHYNHYDIAPYAMGATTLSFSYDDLKDLLKHTK